MRVAPAFGAAQLVEYNSTRLSTFSHSLEALLDIFQSDRLGGGEYWLILPALVLVASVSTESGQNARVITSESSKHIERPSGTSRQIIPFSVLNKPDN